MRRNHENAEPSKQGELFKKRKRDMSDEERVGLLQETIYYKAKQQSYYKFYVLYDKVFIPYFLREAYRRVKSKGGSPGIDGQTFSSIEEGGLKGFLEDLREDLRKHTYKPKAVRRVWIPKAIGKKRPLGIPTIDRKSVA